MNNALWHWALEPGKDYWITLRDWMLYCAGRSHPLAAQYPDFFTKRGLKIGTQLRIRLPRDYHVQR